MNLNQLLQQLWGTDTVEFGYGAPNYETIPGVGTVPHAGVDVPLAGGTAVRALTGGMFDPQESGAYQFAEDTSGGHSLLYEHVVPARQFQPGEAIQPGEVIGTVYPVPAGQTVNYRDPNTGWSYTETGSHVHLQDDTVQHNASAWWQFANTVNPFADPTLGAGAAPAPGAPPSNPISATSPDGSTVTMAPAAPSTTSGSPSDGDPFRGWPIDPGHWGDNVPTPAKVAGAVMGQAQRILFTGLFAVAALGVLFILVNHMSGGSVNVGQLAELAAA